MGIIKTFLNDAKNKDIKFSLVSYTRTQNLKLKEIILEKFSAIETSDYFLHCEYGTLSLDEAINVQNGLEKFEKLLTPDEVIVWQPDKANVEKLDFIEANSKLLRYLDSTKAINQKDITKVMGMQSYLLDRYWAFLLFTGNTIPPGMSFLLDHCSEQIIPKRYIDVRETLQKLGYSFPVGSFQQRMQWNQEAGINMTSLLPEGLESCDLCTRIIKVHKSFT